MRAPILAVLSLAIPVITGSVGFFLARNAKGTTNMGEALGPFFAFAVALVLAALVGELAAIGALARGERQHWLAWLGVAVNGAVLLPVVILLLRADWK